MNRRYFLSTACSTAVIGSISGCSSNGMSAPAEISELEIWNSDDITHTFHVVLFGRNSKNIYENTSNISGTSKNNFTRKILSDAPDSATKIQAKVGKKTDEEDLTDYDKPIQLSVKYNSEEELGIAVFV